MESMAVGKKRQQITLIKRKLVCKSSEREDRRGRGGGGRGWGRRMMCRADEEETR